MTTMPFQAGVDAKDNEILLLQLEGDNCLVYFPDNITDVQLNELIKICHHDKNLLFHLFIKMKCLKIKMYKAYYYMLLIL